MKIIKIHENYLNKLFKYEDGSIIIRDNNTQSKSVNYDSKNELCKYSRRNLSIAKDFLIEADEVDEANRIELYMGKTLRIKDVPQLIPVGNYKTNQPIGTLKDTINRFIEEDGLNFDPDFQRAHVWSMEQRIAFVEFILQEGKTNPIFFNHPGWMKDWKGEMVIVDGKQRLTSLLMFLNNEFPVFKNLDEEHIGFYAKEFDTFGFNCQVVIIINDLPTRKQVLEWYLQINKGNVAHTEEELNKVEQLLSMEV